MKLNNSSSNVLGVIFLLVGIPFAIVGFFSDMSVFKSMGLTYTLAGVVFLVIATRAKRGTNEEQNSEIRELVKRGEKR